MFNSNYYNRNNLEHQHVENEHIDGTSANLCNGLRYGN